jgi:hypothetical protein
MHAKTEELLEVVLCVVNVEAIEGEPNGGFSQLRMQNSHIRVCEGAAIMG